MNYMVHVSSTMWRIKNQASNSTSLYWKCPILLLVLVPGRLYWEFQVTPSFPIWGCVMKGCYERCIFWRAKSHLKGIEGSNLEHEWRLPKSRLRGPTVEFTMGDLFTYIKWTFRLVWSGPRNEIEGLLPLFWGPALHIPFKIFCNPSKRKG